MKQNKTLHDWFMSIGADYSYDKRLCRYSNVEIVKEVSSVDLDGTDKNWRNFLFELRNYAKFKHQNVYNFIVLKNGYAVGLNENPSIGWGFPIIKYTGSLKSESEL